MRPEILNLVLFDLGGVLIRIDGVTTMQELAGIDEPEELWRRWLGCDWVRRFERGRCNAVDFASGVVDTWALPITPDAFLASFTTWPSRPHDGAEDLVAEVRERVQVGCLSNTNAVHWAELERWDLARLFDWKFVSHQIGLVKPDREMFEHVAAAVDLPPATILFLDDNLVNVEQATAAGFTAAHVRGPSEAHAVLSKFGLASAVMGDQSGSGPG